VPLLATCCVTKLSEKLSEKHGRQGGRGVKGAARPTIATGLPPDGNMRGLQVEELKAGLRALSLPVGGNKPALAARLLQAQARPPPHIRPARLAGGGRPRAERLRPHDRETDAACEPPRRL
jgi:hypothetical protein